MRRVNSGLKKVLYVYVGLLVVLIIASITVYVVYNNKVKESAKQSLLAAQKLSNLSLDENTLTEVSSEISKGINEVIGDGVNELLEDENLGEETNEVDTNVNTKEIETNVEPENNREIIEPEIEEPKKELEFIYPVQGDIAKEFAIDNLVFSETLQEWIVHKGIDIKD